jgi:gliding motility-associated-like protein
MRRRDVAFIIFIFAIVLMRCQTANGQGQTLHQDKPPDRFTDNIQAIKKRKLLPVPQVVSNPTVYRFSTTAADNCGRPNTFQATYTQGVDDHIADFVQSPDGSFMLAGQSTGPNAFGRKEAIVLKIDAKGNVILNKRISSAQVNSFNSIINTSDGGYAAVGNTGPAIYLVKLTSTGNVTWSAWFSNNELSGSQGIDLVETQDGGLVVAGNYGNSSGSSDIVIFKTNSSGNLQWSEKFIAGKKAAATGIIVAADALYVSGYCSENYTVPSDGILIKLNGTTGQHYWTKSYDKAGMTDQALSLDYSGNALTLAFSHNDEVTYPYEKSFTKVDLDGKILLSKKINTLKRNDIQRFLAPLADGGYIVAYGNTSDYVPNASIARFDPDGNPVFSKEYTKSGWQLMAGIKALADGTFAMAGDNAPVYNYQDKAELIKTDAAGNTGDCDADSLSVSTTNETLNVSAYQWTSIQSSVYPYGQFATSNESHDNITQNLFCRSLPCDSAAVSPCLETFEKLYGGDGDDIAYDTHTTTDNGYILTGETTSGTSGSRDGFILKVRKNGAISWSKTVGGADADVLSKVTETQDGFTAIGTTRSFGNTKGETFIVHTDASGNLLWSRHYSAGGPAGEKGKSIIQLTDGGYAFISNINDSTSSGDALIARTDALGNIIWSKRFDNGNDDGFNTIIQDGNLLAVGGYASFLNRDAVLMKINLNDGSPLSSRAYYNFSQEDDEMVNVEKINNGLAYSFRSHHKNGTYFINYISCFKERDDETIFYQRRGGSSEENRLLAVSTITTPDSSFVYADCDTTAAGFGEMMKIGPTGLNEWGRDYPQGQYLMSLDRISDRGFVSAGFEKSYSTSGKNKIMLLATDFIGRAGECGPDIGSDFIDTAHYTITPFEWKSITGNAITVSSPVTPQFINSNFATNTMCAATVCDSIPPVSDSCISGAVIKYDSHYSNFLTAVIKASDSNYYASGTHFYNRSAEPVVVKMKPNGEVLWAKTYNQDLRESGFVKILNTMDNNILVMGENNYTINHQSIDSIMVMKLNFDGKVLWAKNYSEGYNYSGITDIIPSDNGQFFLVSTGGSYTIVSRIDMNGNIVWQKEIHSNSSTPVFRSVTFDGKNLFLAGDNYSGNGILTITKLDAATGNYGWSKTVSPGNFQTITQSVETIADTVFVFYILNTPTGNFTSNNNLMMLKLNAESGNIMDNLQLDKPFFTDQNLYGNGTILNNHMPHELIKTSGNNFIFTNQVDNSGKKSLNMVCFNSTGQVQWLRDYPNLNNTTIFTAIQSQDNLLLVSRENKVTVDWNEYVYTGGLIKTDLLGNIKIAADPSAACYSTLLPGTAFTSYTYQDVPSRVDYVKDAPEFTSSFYTPYERDVYFKAQHECNEISNCNLLSISGKDSVCNVSDTINYNIKRNMGCTSPAVWEADTSFMKIITKTDTSLQVMFRKAGNTNIVARISSGCSVITKSFPVVSMISPDILNLGPDKALCGNISVILNAGKGFKSYLWQDGSVDSTFEVKAAGTYYVKATSFCNVAFKDTVILTSAVSLPLFIGNDTTICKNDSLLLSASPGFTSYSWAPSYHINTLSGSRVIVSPVTGTAYTVTAVQQNGCIVRDTIQVSLHDAEPLSLGNDTSICAGTSLLLDAGAGFKKYQWSTGAASQEIMASEVGAYSISAIDNNGCRSADTLQIVQVFAIPLLHLGNDTSLCKGQVLPLNAGAGFKSYLWNTGAITQNIVVANAGTYIINVIDNNLCHATDSISIDSILYAGSIDLGADTMICQGQKILLDAGAGFTSYQWSTGEITQEIYVTKQGRYFIAAKNSNNCISRDSFSVVKVNGLPIINLDKNTSLCSGSSRLLDAGKGVSYLWQDGSTKSTLSAGKTGIYWVQVTNTDGCEASDTTEIRNILATPVDFIDHDTAVCQGMDLTLTPTKQFVNYLWSTGETTPSVKITTSGQYWLQVTDANGCLAKEYLNVTSKNCVSALYVPNAFTPDYNGRNDVFRATLYGAIVKFHLMIFNRFGEKVFESDDVNKGWDGQFKNIDQNSGVFVWYCQYQLKNEPVKTQKGIVTLIR